jgi:Xaa-Pro aminopeptidase
MPALLLFGNTQGAALRHEIPLAIIDSLLWVQDNRRTIVLTTGLERARIAAALPQAEILDFFDFGLRDLRGGGLSHGEADREVVSRVISHLGLTNAIVPSEFPVGFADRLRADGVTLLVDDAVFAMRRRAKEGHELEGVRRAQRAAHAGMAAAERLLAHAQPGPEGRLWLDREELHAEQVRAEIRAACAALGAPAPPDVMVASVWSGFGHEPGSGPLPSGMPIAVDLFPRDEASACWADMTRTFVVGDPTPEHAALLAEQESLVRAALDRALEMVRPGVTGRELFDATCDRFEAAGYRTQRTGPGDDPAEGFQFSLGHGVGLDVHEEPSLGLGGHDPLLPGDVLAIEPGLWDRRLGGVRYEDLVLVTDDGCERLTRYPYGLTPRSDATASPSS